MNATAARLLHRFLESLRLDPGRLHDLGLLLANLWLVPQLGDLAARGMERNTVYAALLLVGPLLYGLGALLKRPGLARRRAAHPLPPAPTWALIGLFTLLILQLGLFMLCTNLALEVLWPSGHTSIGALFMVLGLGSVPLALGIRALIPPAKPGAEAEAKRESRRERLGDLALTATSILFLSLWDGQVMASLERQAALPLWAALPLMILLTVPYAMFALAPRLLYLVEDYRQPQTWLRLVLAMLPLSLRLVV